MLREMLDRDRELQLAIQIQHRASRYKRGTDEPLMLFDDLDRIEEWATELREKLEARNG